MIKLTEFKKKFKTYYQDKKVLWRYIFIAIVLFLILIQLIGKVPHKKLSEVDLDTINFAGEVVPFENEYVFNQEKFDREIAITKLNTAQVVMIYKRLPQYFPYIEKKLEKAWLPDDFKYLAVAESALRNVSYSSAGAAGIWQFMPATARKYGLQVDSNIDERLHFYKATEAAINYLQDLYYIFNDRTLSAAAYNRWENGLVGDMERQYATGYYDMSLNNETSRYIFRIVAIKYLLEHKEEHFVPEILWEQYKSFKTKKIKVSGPVDDLAKWCHEGNFSYHMIKILNPRIIGNKLPEWKWEMEVLR